METIKNLPIIACVHRPQSQAGSIERALRKRNIDLELCHLFNGAPFPNLDHYRALIIFGGPQSANDRDEIICAEHRLVEDALRRKMPLLGICLGAQIIAHVMGGKISADKKGRVEAGFYDIQPTSTACPLFPKKFKAYQWHGEGIDLPSSIPVLAQSEAFPIQAFRADDHAYGLQFHPEVDWVIMNRWIRRDRKDIKRLDKPHARPPLAHYKDFMLHHLKVKSWLNHFISHWLGQAR